MYLHTSQSARTICENLQEQAIIFAITHFKELLDNLKLCQSSNEGYHSIRPNHQ